MFYMGVGNLPGIVARLTQNGRSPDTPVALIGQGTLPPSGSLKGTLATIVGRVEEAKLKPPAIICGGRGQPPPRPPVVRAQAAVRADRGGDAVPYPGQRPGRRAARARGQGTALPHDPDCRARRPRPAPGRRPGIAAFDWILFTSVNAVDSVFAALAARGLDSRALAGVRVRGNRTRTAGAAPGPRPPP